jgi:hypothetical protein
VRRREILSLAIEACTPSSSRPSSSTLSKWTRETDTYEISLSRLMSMSLPIYSSDITLSYQFVFYSIQTTISPHYTITLLLSRTVVLVCRASGLITYYAIDYLSSLICHLLFHNHSAFNIHLSFHNHSLFNNHLPLTNTHYLTLTHHPPNTHHPPSPQNLQHTITHLTPLTTTNHPLNSVLEININRSIHTIVHPTSMLQTLSNHF